MRIDVWSDVVCPWCWLGEARLHKAIAELPADRRDVEVVFRSFELDPRMPRDLDVPTDEILKKKFGASTAQIAAMHAQLRSLGLADGIDFHFELARTSNTFDAHRLIHFARSQGKDRAMVDRLFVANFHDGLRVGDHDVLARLAGEVGLDERGARAALAEGSYTDDVRAEIAEASAIGVTGVPFFLIDGEIAVSGAQSVDVLRRAMGA